MKFNKLFRTEKNNDNPVQTHVPDVETRLIASLPPEKLNPENFRGISKNLAGKFRTLVFAVLALSATKKMQSQQDPNRPQNAVNVQVWHAVLDDEYAGDMATAESNINDQIKPTQSAFLVDTRLYDHAIIFKALLEHVPETTLSHTGNAYTDLNNFTAWINNNSRDLRHYWTWYNNSMNYEGNSFPYVSSGPYEGLTRSIQSGGFDSADTGPHEFAGATGSLSPSYAEGVSGIEYHKDISSVGGPTDAVYNDGKTLGKGNTGGAYLPLYSTPNQYNRGNPANGGDGFNHFTSFGTPFPSWVEYTEIDNEVQEGDGPNTTDGFVDYYNQFPDHLISETTYYNADNGQNENFADPVVPVLQVTNDTLKLTNSADYSLKIPNTYNNAYANQYYTEGDYYVCFYPQGSVANDQYSAKIPLKQLVDGVALSDLGLADGTYEVGIYEWWSNSINFNNVTTFVLDTPPVPDNTNLPAFTGQCDVTITTNDIPTATDNVDGQIDGVPSINNQTITLPYTVNTQGTTVITWTYTDSAGNETTQTQNIIVQDTEAPDVPANLLVDNITGSGFDLSWDAASDNCELAGYEVFLNGVSQGMTTDTSQIFAGLSEGTSYTAGVRSVDASGNTSATVETTITTLGVDDENAPDPNEVGGGLRVYPNPVRTTLKLDLGDAQLAGYEIFSMTGQHLDGQAYFQPENRANIDVRRLPQGVYLLRLNTADGRTAVVRFVKE